MDQPEKYESRISLLPIDLRRAILKDSSYSEIMKLCDVHPEICEDEELWKMLLRRDYPFLSPRTLIPLKLQFNRNDPAPYYIAYKTLHEALFTEASHYFNNYAVCDKRYVNRDLMIEDVMKFLAGVVEEKLEQNKVADPDFDTDIYDATHNILSIMSGLQSEFIGEYQDGLLDFYRAYEVEMDNLRKDLKKFLDLFSRRH